MAASRLIIAVYDSVFTVVIALVLSLAFVSPAYAYVDPSVMTYTIQALAGVAVALSAVLSVAWRRTRKKLFKIFNIDENAHKQVEGDVHRIDPLDSATFKRIDEDAAAARSVEYAERRSGGRKLLSWPKRFGYALVASFFLTFTVAFVAPCEIVAGGSGSLIFGLADVWPVLALFATVLALFAGLVISVLRGRIFDVTVAIVVALGICAYVQALFLNASLPAADGQAVPWDDYTMITVMSAVIWLGIVVVGIVLCLKRNAFFRTATLFICAALIIVQGAGVGSLLLPAGAAAANETDDDATKVHVTEDGLFNVTSKSNVIVFVLDTIDTEFLNSLLVDHPDTLSELTGFTYYRDSVGSMIPTRYAIPYLLTDELPQVGETFQEYRDNQYQRSSFLDDIKAQNYSIGVYSDSIGDGMNGEEEIADKTINVHSMGEFQIDSFRMIVTLEKCALYRDMPWLLKPPFWFYTDEVNGKVAADAVGGYGETPYKMNDIDYYDKLSSDKLSVSDNEYSGAFRFIHLLGVHAPYVMNEHAQAAGPEGATFEQQELGSFEIVNEYVRQLKSLGVYDQTTIVITADHGKWGLVQELTEPTSPIMIVKPSGAPDSPCQISSAKTGHLDYAATIIDAVGGNAEKYGPTVYQATEESRARYYYMTASDGKRDTAIKEMVIDGNVLDFSSWSQTENVWECAK